MTNNRPSVKFTTALRDHSGYGESCRNILIAMDKAGIEITTTIPTFVYEKIKVGKGAELASRYENKKTDYKINLIKLTPNHFFDKAELDKYNIGWFYWEVIGLDPRWTLMCNRMDEIWTASPGQKKNLIRAGVKKPITVIPDCLEIDTSLYKPYTKPEPFLFYSIFQWTERKNPSALIKAFRKTFRNTKGVGLILKVYREDFYTQAKKFITRDVKQYIREMPPLDNYPPIYLYLDGMSEEELRRLHATGDVFVSSHRGEGWGFPQMEAMSFKKPIISTNFLGIHEYLTDSEAWLIPYKLVNVSNMSHIDFYNNKQLWAQIDTKALSRAMREAYDNRELMRGKGLSGEIFVRHEFNYDIVGLKIKNRLLDIYKEVGL